MALHYRLTADKREIKDFPKPSPLSRKQRLKDRNMIIEDFSGLEIKLKYIEGWASFIRKTLSEMPKPALRRSKFICNHKIT